MTKKDTVLSESSILSDADSSTAPLVLQISSSKSVADDDSSLKMFKSTSINNHHHRVAADAANNNNNNNNNNNDVEAGGKPGEAGLAFSYESTFIDQEGGRGGATTTQRCPWRGLTMAVLLLVFGTLLITGGVAFISGTFHLKGLDNVSPYLILVFGALCFIPGAYHILVACCALRGHERFSFDDIPYFS